MAIVAFHLRTAHGPMLPCATHNGRLSAFFHTRTLTLYSHTSLVYTAPPGENYAMTGKERGGWSVCSSSSSHQAQGDGWRGRGDVLSCLPRDPRAREPETCYTIALIQARWPRAAVPPFRLGDTCEESKTMRYLQRGLTHHYPKRATT